MRVVTMLPAATEIAYALGIEPVGVSEACDHPPKATEVPVVVRSRIDPTAGSASIDAQIGAAVAEHGSAHEIDSETLVSTDPDLIVTQATCEICAVDTVLAEDAVDELGLDADVLTVDAHTLDGVLDDIVGIGAAMGRKKRAEAFVADLEARIDRVERAAARATTRPRVSVLDWTDPVMVAGHWVPGMVGLAGGCYGIAEPGGYSPETPWETVCEFDPEVLVVAPCGVDLEGVLERRHELTDREGWAALSAVRTGDAYAVDGNGHVNRPGPRLVDTLEHLAGLVHPDRFPAPPSSVCRALAARSPA